MRIIIVAACVVVIAAGGLYIWQFYEDPKPETAMMSVRVETCNALIEEYRPQNLDYKFCRSWLDVVRKEEEKRLYKKVTGCRKIVNACFGVSELVLSP